MVTIWAGVTASPRARVAPLINPRQMLAGKLPPVTLIPCTFSIGTCPARFSTAVWVGIIALVGLAAQTGVMMLVYLNVAYERRKREGLIRTLDDIIDATLEGSVQRVLNAGRINSIKTFTLQGGDYPNAIVLNWVSPKNTLTTSGGKVAFSVQARSAQIIDGQHRILPSVRHEYPRLATKFSRRHKARRKRDQSIEQIAVPQAERECVRSAIGKSAERDASWIYCNAPER